MNIEQKMTSKEIAEVTGKEHKNIMRDIRNMLEALNLEIGSFLSLSKDSMNRDQEIFNLPKREVELLIMGYSVKLRDKVLDRLREVEQELANPIKAIPETYAQALLEAGKLALEVEQQQLLIESQKPAVDYYNAVAEANNSMTMGEFAKAISSDEFTVGRTKLFDILRTRKVLDSKNVPYQRYMKYFDVTIKSYLDPFTNKSHNTTNVMINGKGQAYVGKRILELHYKGVL